MNPWPAHPDDEWCEVTAYGDRVPKFLLVVSGAELQIERARGRYLAGQIDVEEFEAVFDELVRPTA